MGQYWFVSRLRCDDIRCVQSVIRVKQHDTVEDNDAGRDPGDTQSAYLWYPTTVAPNLTCLALPCRSCRAVIQSHGDRRTIVPGLPFLVEGIITADNTLHPAPRAFGNDFKFLIHLVLQS